MNFYFQNGPWSSSALNEFSYRPWADIKNLLHLASFTEGFTADAKVSCQLQKAAERLQRRSVARWTEREHVAEITHREILLTQNQLLVWKIPQHHILTVSTAGSVSSRWLCENGAMWKHKARVPHVVRLNRTKRHGALGWWLSPEELESLSYTLGVP